MSSSPRPDDALWLAWLDDELSPADRAAFEARLRADPALRAEADELLALHHLVKQDAQWGDTSGTDAPPPHLLDAILRAEPLARPPELKAAIAAHEAARAPRPSIVARLSSWLVGGGVLVGATAALLVVTQRAPEAPAPMTAAATSADVAMRADAAPAASPPPPPAAAMAAPVAADVPVADADFAGGGGGTDVGFASGAVAVQRRGDQQGGYKLEASASAAVGRVSAPAPSMEPSKPSTLAEGRAEDLAGPSGRAAGAAPSSMAAPAPVPPAAPMPAASPKADAPAEAEAAPRAIVGVSAEEARAAFAQRLQHPARPAAANVVDEDDAASAVADKAMSEKKKAASSDDDVADARKGAVAKQAKESKDAARDEMARERRNEQVGFFIATGFRELDAGRPAAALDAFDAAVAVGRGAGGLAPVAGRLRALAALNRPVDAARLAPQMTLVELNLPELVLAVRDGAVVSEQTGDVALAEKLWTRLRAVKSMRAAADAALARLQARTRRETSAPADEPAAASPPR